MPSAAGLPSSRLTGSCSRAGAAGSIPAAPGDFYAPHAIWLDSNRTIYVGEVNWSAGGKDGDIPPDCPCLRRYVKV